MSTESLIRRFHDLACVAPETELDADSLIGFFQVFRPDGAAIAGLYEDFDVGDQLIERLGRLYAAAGDDRRPQGGRDAYFVVRRPLPLDPKLAESLATQWLTGIAELALHVGDTETHQTLVPTPKIRVLEGIPPKHPKREEEKSRLLSTVQQRVPGLVEKIQGGPYAELLRPAYYFTACDNMVRDYLMWPLYQTMDAAVGDPHSPYFELWRHGVKYRIFGDDQVDLYLPRHS
ncbi:MAG: apolipoprotein acyltransferase [Rubripirellula sp.]|nr:apolipoprotein acyltransferase [Rubripirellula sp.]